MIPVHASDLRRAEVGTPALSKRPPERSGAARAGYVAPIDEDEGATDAAESVEDIAQAMADMNRRYQLTCVTPARKEHTSRSPSRSPIVSINADLRHATGDKVLGSPNGLVPSAGPSPLGSPDDFNWEDQLLSGDVVDDDEYWEGSSSGEVVHLKDVDGAVRAISVAEFRKQWADSCGRMQALLRARERTIEDQCIAEVSSARRLGRKRARIAKELAARVTALRELLKQHDTKSPTAIAADGTAVDRDGTPTRGGRQSIMGVQTGFNAPVFNPLEDAGTQCEPPVLCDVSSECQLLNGRTLSVKLLYKSVNHTRIRRILEALLRCQSPAAPLMIPACESCLTDDNCVAWKGNFYTENYLRTHIRSLFARELSREAEELQTKHEKERTMQALLLHDMGQTAHNAAMALQKQLEQAEKIGRILVIRNLVVRSTFDKLQARGQHGLISRWRLTQMLDDAIAKAIREEAAASAAHKAAVRKLNQLHDEKLREVTSSFTSQISTMAEEHEEARKKLEKQLHDEQEFAAAKRTELEAELLLHSTAGRIGWLKVLIQMHNTVWWLPQMLRTVRRWCASMEVAQTIARCNDAYAKSSEIMRKALVGSAAAKIISLVFREQLVQCKSNAIHEMHVNWVRHRGKIVAGLTKLGMCSLFSPSLKMRMVVAAIRSNMAAHKSRTQHAKDKVTQRKHAVQLVHSVEASILSYEKVEYKTQEVAKYRLHLWRSKTVIATRDEEKIEMEKAHTIELNRYKNRSAFVCLWGWMKQKLTSETKHARATNEMQETIEEQKINREQLLERIALLEADSAHQKQTIANERHQFGLEKENLQAQVALLTSEAEMATIEWRQNLSCKIFMRYMYESVEAHTIQMAIHVWEARMKIDRFEITAAIHLEKALATCVLQQMDKVIAAQVEVDEMKKDVEIYHQKDVELNEQKQLLIIELQPLKNQALEHQAALFHYSLRLQSRIMNNFTKKSIVQMLINWRVNMGKYRATVRRSYENMLWFAYCIKRIAVIEWRLNRKISMLSGKGRQKDNVRRLIGLCVAIKGEIFMEEVGKSVASWYETMCAQQVKEGTKPETVNKPPRVFGENRPKASLTKKAGLKPVPVAPPPAPAPVAPAQADPTSLAEVELSKALRSGDQTAVKKAEASLAKAEKEKKEKKAAARKKKQEEVAAMRNRALSSGIGGGKGPAGFHGAVHALLLMQARGVVMIYSELKSRETASVNKCLQGILFNYRVFKAEEEKRVFDEMARKPRVRRIWLNMLRRDQVKAVSTWRTRFLNYKLTKAAEESKQAGEAVAEAVVVTTKAKKAAKLAQEKYTDAVESGDETKIQLAKQELQYALVEVEHAETKEKWFIKEKLEQEEKGGPDNLVYSELSGRMTRQKMMAFIASSWKHKLQSVRIRLTVLQFHSNYLAIDGGMKAKRLQKELDASQTVNTALTATNEALQKDNGFLSENLDQTRAELVATRKSEAATERLLKLAQRKVNKAGTFYLKVVGRRTFRRVMTRCVNNFRNKWFAHRLHLADPDNLMAKWEIAEARAEYCEEKAATMMKQLLDTEDQATELALVLNSEKKVNGRDANIARSALALEQQRRFFIALQAALVSCTNVCIARMVTRWRNNHDNERVMQALRIELADAVSSASDATKRVQNVMRLPKTTKLLDMKYKAAQHGKLMTQQKKAYFLLLYALFCQWPDQRARLLQNTLRVWSLIVQRNRFSKRQNSGESKASSASLELKQVREKAEELLRVCEVKLATATHSLALEKEMVVQLQEQLFTGIKDSVGHAQRESLKAEHAKASADQANKKIRNLDQMASQLNKDKEHALEVILLQKRELEHSRVQMEAVELDLQHTQKEKAMLQQTEKDICTAVISSHAVLVELGSTIEQQDVKSEYPSEASVVGCVESDTKYMQQLTRKLEVHRRTGHLQGRTGQGALDSPWEGPGNSISSPSPNIMDSPIESFFVSQQNPFEDTTANPFKERGNTPEAMRNTPTPTRQPKAAKALHQSLSRARATPGIRAGTPGIRAKTNHGPRKIGGLTGGPSVYSAVLGVASVEDSYLSPQSRAKLPPLALVNPALISRDLQNENLI